MADEYIKRSDVRDALHSAIIDWNKDCGIARMEYLRIRLNNVPTAVVVPVRHGRWKKSYADHEAFGVRPFFRYCSECHEATVYPYNYCPNCGAKMEVQDDN